MSERPDWYYTNNRQPNGPVSADQLRRLASRGGLQSSDLVWKEGMAAWEPAATVPGLFLDDNAPPPLRRGYDDEEYARPQRKRHVEYDDDEDLRLRRRTKPKSHLALILTLTIGGLVLLLGGGIVVFILMIANLQAGTIPLTPGTGPWNCELTVFDADDPESAGCYCKIYTYPMTAGKTYTIDMQSGDLDSFLRLEDSNQVQLAFNDDAFPGTQDSQIVHTATKTGQYRIVATSLNPGETGKFRLKISP